MKDSVRFRMSDRNGSLVFETLRVEDRPLPEKVQRMIDSKILKRSLAEIDVAAVRQQATPDTRAIVLAIAETIEECQEMLVGE